MRGLLVAGGVLVLVVAGGCGRRVHRRPARRARPDAGVRGGVGPRRTDEVRTADVEQRTMQTAADLDGTLGYEDGSDVAAGADGTRHPAARRRARSSSAASVLYELDGRVRPRLLYGDRPLWRPLGPDVTDGADVLQLERNLKAMGFAPKGMKVDRHWDATRRPAR